MSHEESGDCGTQEEEGKPNSPTKLKPFDADRFEHLMARLDAARVRFMAAIDEYCAIAETIEREFMSPEDEDEARSKGRNGGKEAQQ